MSTSVKKRGQYGAGSTKAFGGGSGGGGGGAGGAGADAPVQLHVTLQQLQGTPNIFCARPLHLLAGNLLQRMWERLPAAAKLSLSASAEKLGR